ncbi:MAG: hypothetical protein K0U20_08155, partial [Proteobacteria bacterium]|nr:hypothetical protein [Pseudomonadota bacterium]
VGGSSAVSGIQFKNTVSSNGYVYYDNGANMNFHTNGTERLRIQSGGGISFNGDTAAANALDDYEEGTYTAAFVGVGTVVLSSNVLKYKKVGNMVTTGGQVRVTSQSGVTGGFKLTLPFTSAGGLEVGAVRLYTVNFNDAARGPICYTGGAELVFDMSVDNSSSSAVPVTTSGYYMFGITYQTA